MLLENQHTKMYSLFRNFFFPFLLLFLSIIPSWNPDPQSRFGFRIRIQLKLPKKRVKYYLGELEHGNPSCIPRKKNILQFFNSFFDVYRSLCQFNLFKNLVPDPEPDEDQNSTKSPESGSGVNESGSEKLPFTSCYTPPSPILSFLNFLQYYRGP